MNTYLELSAPLRLSLAGGGTDLPNYYMKSGARILAVALDSRIYVEIGDNITHQPSMLTDLFKSNHPSLNVQVRSNVSPGAGLGGSGAMATALATASIYLEKGEMPSAIEAGLLAYYWERELLGQPTGFQDQLAAAVGGCVEMTASKSGKIKAFKRPDLLDGIHYFMENNFILIETGLRRNASLFLEKLANSYSKPNKAGPATVEDVEQAIVNRDAEKFGILLKNHWESKCYRLPETTNPEIDFMIQTALDAGADGAKVIGAGGGGFILISAHTEKRPAVISRLDSIGCVLADFSVSDHGVRLENKKDYENEFYLQEACYGIK